jgi:hypothetical protein
MAPDLGNDGRQEVNSRHQQHYAEGDKRRVGCIGV